MGAIDTTVWYNKYTNLPFLHLGDDPLVGLDCFNLCRYIYKQELSIDVPLSTSDFCNIVDEDWYVKTSEQLFENGAKLTTSTFSWAKVVTPKIYDIILLSIGATNITNHCAMYVGTNKILHTMSGRTSWVAPYGGYYKQYTTGIYRWNATLNY